MKLEEQANEPADNTRYGAGIGVSSKGIALNVDVEKTWLFLTPDVVAAGYKVRF